MNRVVEAGEILKSFLQSVISTATITRTYTPAARLDGTDLSTLQIFLTPEDVRCDLKTHNGKKFTDYVTYTIAIVQKVTDTSDPTTEVDGLLETVQTIRDSLIFQFHPATSNTLRLITTQAENSSSRPLYERGRLEDQNLFCSFLLVEVMVNGQKT